MAGPQLSSNHILMVRLVRFVRFGTALPRTHVMDQSRALNQSGLSCESLRPVTGGDMSQNAYYARKGVVDKTSPLRGKQGGP